MARLPSEQEARLLRLEVSPIAGVTPGRRRLLVSPILVDSTLPLRESARLFYFQPLARQKKATATVTVAMTHVNFYLVSSVSRFGLALPLLW